MSASTVSIRKPDDWYNRTPGEGDLTYAFRIENPQYFTGISLLRTDISADVLAQYQKLQREDIKGPQADVECLFQPQTQS